MDGGIRSGQDVLKARALGARGTLHRPQLPVRRWARTGEAGVTRALQIIHKELDITMAFCGRTQHRRRSTRASCCRAPSEARAPWRVGSQVDGAG